MRKKNTAHAILEKIAQGVLLSFLILAVSLWADKNTTPGDVFLYSTVPNYDLKQTAVVSRSGTDDRYGVFAAEGISFVDNPGVTADDVPDAASDNDVVLDGLAAPDDDTVPGDTRDIIGINDVIFQPETPTEQAESSADKEAITYVDLEKLYDFDYLKTRFYVASKETSLLPGDIDVDAFLEADMTLNENVDGPKILIFHTHSNEKFADSDPNDPMDSVMGLGATLASILSEQYGIQTLHHTGRYDIVNGRSQISGAYERMESVVQQILLDNPTVEVAIDLHRDGVNEGVAPFVTTINGERTARIMFVNGLSRIYADEGLVSVSWLPNAYQTDNLALSFRLQLTANSLYPDFTRKLYLKGYRYSLHMLPKSILVEIGAQNNTMREAMNAMAPLAEILAHVLTP